MAELQPLQTRRDNLAREIARRTQHGVLTAAAVTQLDALRAALAKVEGELATGAVVADWQLAGRQAHAAGLPRVPMADVRVHVACAGMSVGQGAVRLFRDWTRGWDAANLSALVTL